MFNEAIPILEELINDGRISRPNLGIRGRDITAEEEKTYDVPRGVLIDSVLPGSGAESADIRPGDILTRFDGARVETIRALIDLVQSRQVGDTVTVTLVRDGRTLEIEATLGYEIGGIPPFCHDEPVPVYLDETLTEFETVWAAAGSPTAVFPIDVETLVACSDATVADIVE